MTAFDARRPLIFGEVLFDRFPDGSTVLGGAPFNVAWNLKALGLDPLLISRVGRDDLGADILAAMRGWGLDPRGIQTDDVHPTGTVEVALEDGEPRFEIAAGRAYDFIAAEDLPPLAGAGVLYHGSLALRTEASRLALDRLRSTAAGPILMDVNLRDPWWNPELVARWMSQASWVKLNEDELARLVPEEPDLRRRSARLLGQGDLATVLVTRGAAGAYAAGREGWTCAPAPVAAPAVVDTVGAGDAFSSVIILGISRGWPVAGTLDRALAFAAGVVGLRGATTVDRAFYEGFRTDWEKE
jgi:fructokinase